MQAALQETAAFALSSSLTPSMQTATWLQKAVPVEPFTNRGELSLVEFPICKPRPRQGYGSRVSRMPPRRLRAFPELRPSLLEYQRHLAAAGELGRAHDPSLNALWCSAGRAGAGFEEKVRQHHLLSGPGLAYAL